VSLLKSGDVVRLQKNLPLFEVGADLPKGTKGTVVTVDERGYTILFEGELAPVTALTDLDVQLDLGVAEK